MNISHWVHRCISGFVAAVLCIGTALPIAAAAEEDDSSNTFDDGTLTYTKLDSTTVSVTGCEKTTSYVSIMPKIDGYDVVSIGEEAFANCEKLKSVTIPVSVTEIGSAAFYGCSSLEKIALPDAVTTIESGTFVGCSSLTEITLGSQVKTIGDMAFGYCSSLTDITLPDTLETVGDQLFYYCTALEHVDIPEHITSLGAYTFYACLSLSEFTIPATLEDIGAMSFLGCSGLEKIDAAEGNPNYVVSENILYNSDKSILYLYPAGRTDTAFTLPDSVLVIYAGAFFASSALQQVTFNDGLQYIGEMAFDFCAGLTSLTIPESVTTIGTTAFSDCTGLTAVTFAGTEKEDGGEGDALEIGDYAFFCCDNLKEVTLPKRVSSIGSYAFGCTSPEDVDDENAVADGDDEIAVEALDDFLLIGYTGTASDYVKECSVDLNFKPVNFNWARLVICVCGAAAILLIIIFAVRMIRKNMMTAEEKEALDTAKQVQKTPLSARNGASDLSEHAEDDGYRSIIDDDDEEEESEELLTYDETISHSRMHSFGHAAHTDENEK